MKVAIIVDDLDSDRRRRCFWEEQLAGLPDVQYDLISLLQKMEERKFFNVYAYDVVIFNWCVLDGSMMYASDRVQAIVEFYDDHFFQFVRKGGILIIENQPKRWRPAQKGYDTLLRGQVKVVDREQHFFANKVHVNPRFKRHPLIQHLQSTLHTSYAHPLNESWFPPDSTSARSIQELHPTKFYSGAFESWGSDWLPVLYTDDNRYPVMLLKTEGLGLWIVTTMYLASSNHGDLIEALICGSQKNSYAIRQFHASQKRTRTLEFARIAVITALIAALIYLALISGIISADIPYGNTVIGNVAFSVLLSLLAAGLTLLQKYVRRRARNALNK